MMPYRRVDRDYPIPEEARVVLKEGAILGLGACAIDWTR